MNLETIPDPVVGLCYKLSRRHPEPEDAMQELLLQAWLNRGLNPKILTKCLQRRAIDSWRKSVGYFTKGLHPKMHEITPSDSPIYKEPEPFEWRGPEPEIVAALVDGQSQTEIARAFGVHPGTISKRCNLIRAHILAMRAAA